MPCSNWNAKKIANRNAMCGHWHTVCFFLDGRMKRLVTATLRKMQEVLFPRTLTQNLFGCFLLQYFLCLSDDVIDASVAWITSNRLWKQAAKVISFAVGLVLHFYLWALFAARHTNNKITKLLAIARQRDDLKAHALHLLGPRSCVRVKETKRLC